MCLLVLRALRVQPQVTEQLGKRIHCHESDLYRWEKSDPLPNSPLIFPLDKDFPPPVSPVPDHEATVRWAHDHAPDSNATATEG
ncbi:hypothetical protein TNCT6_59400 [Streptomyces sp. 6-11-2]|nr:hypothetical protein TNCT6_59400 [Streptomyces sp. 6-11-2]